MPGTAPVPAKAGAVDGRPGPRHGTPRRIAMTADAVGGVWQYALDLAHGLAAVEIGTDLLVLGPPPGPAAERAAGAVPGLRLHPVATPLDWAGAGPEEIDRGTRALADAIARLDPPLVHLNHPAYAEATDGRPTVAVVHSCVATWWRAVRGGRPPEAFREATERIRRALATTSAAVAPTAALAAALTEIYRPPRVIRVVHNGRRPPRPSVGPGRTGYAFTAGRLWDEGKNLALLDRAAARLARPIAAAGPTEGPNGAAVSLQNVIRLGPLDDATIAGWMADAEVFVSAARYEPFGLAVLEAARSGTPLVLSDIPTFRELWEGAALFADPDHVAGFARAIETVLDAPRLAADLADRAARRAARYTIEAQAKAMRAIYADIAGPALYTPAPAMAAARTEAPA